MPRHRLKKNDIDNAGIELFASRGIIGTTIKQIAKLAGVTDGALYRYYKGKEAMAWSLYKQEVSEFIRELKPLLDSDDPLPKKLKEVIRYIYNYFLEHPNELVFVLFTRQSFPNKRIAQSKINPDRIINEVITREFAKGTIPETNVELLVAMIRGIILEPILMFRYSALTTHPIEFVDIVAERCLLMLKGKIK